MMDIQNSNALAIGVAMFVGATSLLITDQPVDLPLVPHPVQFNSLFIGAQLLLFVLPVALIGFAIQPETRIGRIGAVAWRVISWRLPMLR
jgi:hypothetical protein